MLTRLKLTNFKSWQNLDIELAPITLLFGTNSSGKSSILQSLLLLKQTAEKTIGNSVNFGGTQSDYIDLGSYRDVVYSHNLKRKIIIEIFFSSKRRRIELSYTKDEVSIEEIPPAALDFFIEQPNQVHYLGPLRQYPRRNYLWTGVVPETVEKDGENIIATLIASHRNDLNLLTRVSEWLEQMGIVDEFFIASLDKDKRFYETKVKIDETVSSLLDVGFGVSQVLPIITLLFFAPEGSIILLEQPELHLHPRAQAVLADLFLEVAEKRKLQLIVESHSEHLLRRMQRRIAEPEYAFATPENVKAYFCENGENGSEITHVEIDRFGQIRNWPKKFFGDIGGDLEAMMDAAIARRREELMSSG